MGYVPPANPSDPTRPLARLVGGKLLNANVSTFTTYVLAHELGHALRLGDEQDSNFICSEAQSVMYPSGSVGWGCGVIAPKSCDPTGINSVYPSTVQSCNPYTPDPREDPQCQ